MRAYFRLIRTHHWIKNGFLFIPVFFAGELFDIQNLITLLLGFLSFSLTASSIYVLNDLRDKDSDLLHPKKKMRPLASGAISSSTARLLIVLLAISGLGIAYFLNQQFVLIILLYFFLNLAYSLGLKNRSIIDIFILASGFLLRTVSGALLVGAEVTQWLIIMIFLLALFLAFAKRRDDVLIFMESGKITRKSIQEYNLDFINMCITMLSGVIIVAYLMYSISADVTERFNNEHIYFTSVFVIAGIIRYMQITFVEEQSGSPTKILYSDKFIQLAIAGWLLSFFIIIYVGKF